MIAGWDWYATFAKLANVNPYDHLAKAAGLPEIDSVDVWPLVASLQNGTSRPRDVVFIAATTGWTGEWGSIDNSDEVLLAGVI